MNARMTRLAAIVGLSMGLIASAAMTFSDWRLNPSGVFYDESGTSWGTVAETAISWFWPVALVSFLLTAIVLYSIASTKKN